MDPDMRLGIQMTHSDECYRWHHECAVVKVDALRARIEVLEKVAEAAEEYRIARDSYNSGSRVLINDLMRETMDDPGLDPFYRVCAALDAAKEGKG